MEQICKVEICGIVGVCHEVLVHEKRHLRMSVATNYKVGPSVVTDWFNVSWWPAENDHREFSKGDLIHAEGRLVSHEYASPAGEIRRVYEIKAQKIW